MQFFRDGVRFSYLSRSVYDDVFRRVFQKVLLPFQVHLLAGHAPLRNRAYRESRDRAYRLPGNEHDRVVVLFLVRSVGERRLRIFARVLRRVVRYSGLRVLVGDHFRYQGTLEVRMSLEEEQFRVLLERAFVRVLRNGTVLQLGVGFGFRERVLSFHEVAEGLRSEGVEYRHVGRPVRVSRQTRGFAFSASGAQSFVVRRLLAFEFVSFYQHASVRSRKVPMAERYARTWEN